MSAFTPDSPMTPNNPFWNAFIERLWTALAFEYDADGEPVDWECQNDRRHTVDALRDLGLTFHGVKASLALFRKHGGFCDCEVLMNAVHFLEQEVAP